MKEIVFYHSRICLKCIRVRKITKEIQQEYPDAKIKKTLLIKILKREIYTIPAIEINANKLSNDEITKNRILKELGVI